jgi:hypothetical protein
MNWEGRDDITGAGLAALGLTQAPHAPGLDCSGQRNRVLAEKAPR